MSLDKTSCSEWLISIPMPSNSAGVNYPVQPFRRPWIIAFIGFFQSCCFFALTRTAGCPLILGIDLALHFLCDGQHHCSSMMASNGKGYSLWGWIDGSGKYRPNLRIVHRNRPQAWQEVSAHSVDRAGRGLFNWYWFVPGIFAIKTLIPCDLQKYCLTTIEIICKIQWFGEMDNLTKVPMLESVSWSNSKICRRS